MSTYDPHPSLMACIDLETTGLDEQTGLVLEVAARVVTNDLSPVDDGISLVVAQQSPRDSVFPVFQWRGRMNDFVVDMHTKSGLIADVDRASLTVVDMHTKSGLIADVDRASLTVADVDARIAAYLESHADGVPLLLVGNSITLDRNFLREHLPLTFAKLHHRSIDLTSVELFLARYSGLDMDRVAPLTGHRAMDDVDACLATGRSIGDQLDYAI